MDMAQAVHDAFVQLGVEPHKERVGEGMEDMLGVDIDALNLELAVKPEKVISYYACSAKEGHKVLVSATSFTAFPVVTVPACQPIKGGMSSSTNAGTVSCQDLHSPVHAVFDSLCV